MVKFNFINLDTINEKTPLNGIFLFSNFEKGRDEINDLTFKLETATIDDIPFQLKEINKKIAKKQQAITQMFSNCYIKKNLDQDVEKYLEEFRELQKDYEKIKQFSLDENRLEHLQRIDHKFSIFCSKCRVLLEEKEEDIADHNATVEAIKSKLISIQKIAAKLNILIEYILEKEEMIKKVDKMALEYNQLIAEPCETIEKAKIRFKQLQTLYQKMSDYYFEIVEFLKKQDLKVTIETLIEQVNQRAEKQLAQEAEEIIEPEIENQKELAKTEEYEMQISIFDSIMDSIESMISYKQENYILIKYTLKNGKKYLSIIEDNDLVIDQVNSFLKNSNLPLIEMTKKSVKSMIKLIYENCNLFYRFEEKLYYIKYIDRENHQMKDYIKECDQVLPYVKDIVQKQVSFICSLAPLWSGETIEQYPNVLYQDENPIHFFDDCVTDTEIAKRNIIIHSFLSKNPKKIVVEDMLYSIYDKSLIQKAREI